jgi:hypothetical protein
MADDQPKPKPEPPLKGSQLGEILVTLGYATQEQIDSGLKTQQAQRDAQKLHPDDPAFKPQLIGQILEDQTKDSKNPITEKQIQDVLTIQKELRDGFRGEQPTPDQVNERIHQIAKQHGIEDKSETLGMNEGEKAPNVDWKQAYSDHAENLLSQCSERAVNTQQPHIEGNDKRWA